MTLPTWLPQTSRPREPSWQATWDAMTPNERRASFLFDAVLVGIVAFLAWYFS